MDGSANYKQNKFTKNMIHAVFTPYGTFKFKKGNIPAYMTTNFFMWKNYWNKYRDGMLPYDKSWLNHPNNIIKVFDSFSTLMKAKGG